MTDGLQPDYVDEPTCRVCGVALADHPRVAELCQRVRTLESHALESAEKLQRLATYETCTGEIECTCWGCLMDRSKWQKGELERLKQAVSKMSHRRCHDCGHVAYYLDCTIPECNCEKCGSSDTRRVKEATDG